MRTFCFMNLYNSMVPVQKVRITIEFVNMNYAKFRIIHKHQYQHPYHQHYRANTLRQAERSIKKHDRWQINGRKW